MAFLISSPEFSASACCYRSLDSPVKFFSNWNLIPYPCFRNQKTLVILKNNEEIGARARARVRVCSVIKDWEVRVSDFDQDGRMYGQFSAQVKPDPKQSKEEEEKQNYYVNLGYAIRTLRDEFPELFYKELNFDIYRDDIVFKDPLNTFIGIENYKSIFWALRVHGKIFFKALWVDIISVWQPVENIIMIRWTVHGIPRVPWESRGRFDGTSVYKLDKNGKIFEHRVDNIALNSPPKFGVLAMQEIIQSLGCPSTPKPTYFETSSLALSLAQRHEAESSNRI